MDNWSNLHRYLPAVIVSRGEVMYIRVRCHMVVDFYGYYTWPQPFMLA